MRTALHIFIAICVLFAAYDLGKFVKAKVEAHRSEVEACENYIGTSDLSECKNQISQFQP